MTEQALVVCCSLLGVSALSLICGGVGEKENSL